MVTYVDVQAVLKDRKKTGLDMKTLPHYRSAEDLEQTLGDPLDPTQRFSFKYAVELDEHEIFPSEACELLEEWGLHEYYIPAKYGGKLTHFEEVLALMRVVSRRDL